MNALAHTPLDIPSRPVLRLVDTDLDSPPRESTPIADMPPIGPWAARIARTAVEVAMGERPVSQLNRWVNRETFIDLSSRAAAASRHPAVVGRAPQTRRVRSVRLCHISPGIVEACAVVCGETRARAVAMRFEAFDGKWLATAVDLG